MKIELPNTWKYKTEIMVRVSDLNYGNHLANQNFLAYAQEARLRYFMHYSYTELDFGGVSLIQADAAITYKGEAFYGDILVIELSAVKTGNSAFDVFYKFTNKETGKLLAEVRTAIVCYDYETKKVVAIPPAVNDSGLFADF